MRFRRLWQLVDVQLAFWTQVDTARSLPLYYYADAGARQLSKRDRPQFDTGQPIDGAGKGGPILGGTNHQLDLQNPSNLGQQPTDNGVVPNLKWSFSQSKTRISAGGWTRKQTITDLPASHDMSGAQQHLAQGAIREPHWHSTAEWGFVYNGSVLVSAVDADGKYQAETLGFGDIWYFPRGVAHTVQGMGDQNEFLLVFDGPDTDAAGSTFNVDDWVAHTPRDVLAKNFGVDAAVFDGVPRPSPGVLNGTVGGGDADRGVTAGPGEQPAAGADSFVFRTLQQPPIQAPGGGGSLYKVDSTNFPRSTSIAAALVTLVPGAMREMHWHPDVSIASPWPVNPGRNQNTHRHTPRYTYAVSQYHLTSRHTGRGMALLPPRHRPSNRIHGRRQRAHLRLRGGRHGGVPGRVGPLCGEHVGGLGAHVSGGLPVKSDCRHLAGAVAGADAARDGGAGAQGGRERDQEAAQGQAGAATGWGAASCWRLA